MASFGRTLWLENGAYALLLWTAAFDIGRTQGLWDGLAVCSRNVAVHIQNDHIVWQTLTFLFRKCYLPRRLTKPVASLARLATVFATSVMILQKIVIDLRLPHRSCKIDDCVFDFGSIWWNIVIRLWLMYWSCTTRDCVSDFSSILEKRIGRQFIKNFTCFLVLGYAIAGERNLFLLS